MKILCRLFGHKKKDVYFLYERRNIMTGIIIEVRYCRRCDKNIITNKGKDPNFKTKEEKRLTE